MNFSIERTRLMEELQALPTSSSKVKPTNACVPASFCQNDSPNSILELEH